MIEKWDGTGRCPSDDMCICICAFGMHVIDGVFLAYPPLSWLPRVGQMAMIGWLYTI